MDEIGNERSQNEYLVNFRIFYTIVQMIGLTIIILMGSWISIFLGGLGISTPNLEFNWHPLLMTIGMVFLYGNGILLYRGYRNSKKSKLKLTHASIFGIVMVLTILGLIAVFDSHNNHNPPTPNLYSLHSWIGLTAVIVFGCQWVAGFISFLYPQIRTPMKALYMPIHVYFGLFGYMLVIVAALMGLSEKAFFKIKNYSELPHEALLVNSIGALIVLFGALVCYVVTKTEYKRQPLPEDQILLTGAAD